MKDKQERTNSNIQLFNYEGTLIRTVLLNGEPWLVAKDVAEILGIQNIRQNMDELDADEKGVCNVYTPGGMQDMTVINEPGLYKLTFKSRKPAAKKFTRWVTHEVLPSIRKTGSYHAKKRCSPLRSFKDAEALIDKAIDCKTNDECQKVEALDRVFQDLYGYSVLDVAQIHPEPKPEAQPEEHLNEREAELWKHIVSTFDFDEWFSIPTLRKTFNGELSIHQMRRYLCSFAEQQLLSKRGYYRNLRYTRRH